MNGQGFDDLCCGLAVAHSRRRVIGGLATTIGGGAALWLLGLGTRTALAQPRTCNSGQANFQSYQVWRAALDDSLICMESYIPFEWVKCFINANAKALSAAREKRENECQLSSGYYGGECVDDPAMPAGTGLCCSSGMRAWGGVCYPECPVCQKGNGASCKPCDQCEFCRGGAGICMKVDPRGVYWKTCGPNCCPVQEHCCSSFSCCKDASKCCMNLVGCCDDDEQCCNGPNGGCAPSNHTCCPDGSNCDTEDNYQCTPGVGGKYYCA
jgi:hypothetical protein